MQALLEICRVALVSLEPTPPLDLLQCANSHTRYILRSNLSTKFERKIQDSFGMVDLVIDLYVNKHAYTKDVYVSNSYGRYRR